MHRCANTARDGVVEWDICLGDGVDGGVVVTATCKTSRDQLLSSAMVVLAEFGVALRGSLCLYKMSIFPLYFSIVFVPE